MSIQYSNIIDPRLIEAINHVADAICKVADAIDRSKKQFETGEELRNVQVFQTKKPFRVSHD